MTPTSHFIALLIGGVASLLASACATGDLLTNRVDVGGVEYDAQECVENALRHRPDPAAVSDAAVAFARACHEGEAASCSVLGVMYELGRGFPMNRPYARLLYRAACEAQNVRACTNLGELLLRDASAARAPGPAVSMLRPSCGGGGQRACAGLGQTYRDSNTVDESGVPRAGP